MTASQAGCVSPPRPAPASVGLMVLLTAMSAVGPLSLQIFVPALPAIQSHFAVAPGLAQLTLSLSILANAMAALTYGPLSDRFGRRPVVLGGLVMFVAGSVMCTLAPTIGMLVVGRILQAAGGAGGMVIARAIVRDLYERDRAAAMIAYLTMAMVVAPMLAPVVGALLLELAGWRSIFAVLIGIGAVLVLGLQWKMPETRAGGSGGSGWSELLSGTALLLRSRAFLAYVLQSTFAISVFLAFVAGAPYYMIDILDRPAIEYGLYFIAVSLGFMAGNFVAARVTKRIGLNRMVVIGSWLVVVGTGIVAALLSAGMWTPLSLFGPLMLTTFGNGLAIPNAQAGAISVDPALAGTASGLSGFVQMALGALVSQLVGILQDGTPYAMAGFMLGCAVLSLLSVVMLLRPARREG